MACFCSLPYGRTHAGPAEQHRRFSRTYAHEFTAPHMARAAFEGVTLGLGYGLARFRELGMHPLKSALPERK